MHAVPTKCRSEIYVYKQSFATVTSFPNRVKSSSAFAIFSLLEERLGNWL